MGGYFDRDIRRGVLQFEEYDVVNVALCRRNECAAVLEGKFSQFSQNVDQHV